MAHKKLTSLLIIPALLLGLAQIAAQVAPEPPDLFIPMLQIGENRPSGLRYDVNYDRFAWVGKDGTLVIVDAATLAPLHVLYPSGNFSAFSFSPNGRLLAVAIDLRIDIWDVESGVLVATFEPPGARRVQGPLQFTRGDELLLFDTLVPAPQELRRSENDTVILPWLWDVAAARDLRNSVLPNRVTAYPFYNVRVSMIAGENGVLVSGLDNRIQIYDADTPTLEMIADIQTIRLETDPLVAWRSATDPYLYASISGYDEIMQVDTLTNQTGMLELGYDLDLPAMDRLKQLSFSRAAQPIGDGSSQINPLTQLLLGDEYARNYDYQPLLFNLIDLLIPLTDDPLRDPASDVALLAYKFSEATGAGSADLFHPGGINQMAISPDLRRLAMRRQSGEVELYDIATGALERILTPSEPDAEGRRPLAFTDDSRTLLVDFERYHAETGERLMRAPQFTKPFGEIRFTEDNELVTFDSYPQDNFEGGTTQWRMWDIGNGQLLREDRFTVEGSLLRERSDGLRILTTKGLPDGAVEIIVSDAVANSRESMLIPSLPNGQGISWIVPNDDWTRFLVGYTDNITSTTPLAVYNRAGERLFFSDEPLTVTGDGTRWLNEETFELLTYYGGSQRSGIVGLDYHPSGLPQCVVDALPDQWQSLIPAWERFAYFSPEQVDAFTLKLCAALTGEGAQNIHAAEGTPAVPTDATAVIDLMTPTFEPDYRSARTPAPIAVPGVPTCITSYHRSQAAAYADLWRQITATLTDPAQLAEINQMICEGLLGDLGGLQPTATVNPNALVVATPTPMDAAPETTAGNENQVNIVTINIETGARTILRNVPLPSFPARRDAHDLLWDFYREQFGTYPPDLIISPDGHFTAVRNPDGFITVYRLARPVSELLQEERNKVTGQAADAPRSIGLPATATQAPAALHTPLPSATATVTLTPIPLPQRETTLPQWGESQFMCPARRLTTLDNAPDGFQPPGTLLILAAQDFGFVNFLWELNPRTGIMKGNTQLPLCGGINESCNTSPDGEWLVQQQYAPDGTAGDVVVSRRDGTDATTLMTAPEVRLISPSFSWREPHTLYISYNGVLPTLSPDAVGLISTYDPETRTRSEGRLLPTPVPLGLLPFEVVSRQPYGTLELLAEHFSGGTRYYFRDRSSGETRLFAQGISDWNWQPAGRFFYYGAGENRYIYDTLTRENALFGEFEGSAFPSDSVWSPDGHLFAMHMSATSAEIDRALLAGELPPRIAVWNSDTGLLYTYCVPELGRGGLGWSFAWSPDSRYLTFWASLPPEGDIAPTPTFAISPEAPPPTSTPMSPEEQYQYGFVRTMILDTATGQIVVIGSGFGAAYDWLEGE